MKHIGFAAAACLAASPLLAQDARPNPIDVVRPDAPELAAYGDFPVGVRTLTLTDRLAYAGGTWDIESIAPDTPNRGEIEITATRAA